MEASNWNKLILSKTGFFLSNRKNHLLHKLNQISYNFELYFEEPMNGLSSGSQVLLNGIKMGEVVSLEILKENPSKCLVVINAKNIKSHLMEAQLIYLEIWGNRGVNILFKKTEEMLPRFDGLEQIKSTKSTFSKFLNSTESINKEQKSFVSSANEIQRTSRKLLDSTESISKEQIESLASSANEIAALIKPAIDYIVKLIVCIQ